jgi:hypothetical protein
MAWGNDELNQVGTLLDGMVEEHKIPPDQRLNHGDGNAGTLAALTALGFEADEVMDRANQVAVRYLNDPTCPPQAALVSSYIGGLLVGAALGRGEGEPNETDS